MKKNFLVAVQEYRNFGQVSEITLSKIIGVKPKEEKKLVNYFSSRRNAINKIAFYAAKM